MRSNAEIAVELRARDDWQHTSELGPYRLKIYWSDYFGGYREVIKRGEDWQWELTMLNRDELVRIAEERLSLKAKRSREAERVFRD